MITRHYGSLLILTVIAGGCVIKWNHSVKDANVQLTAAHAPAGFRERGDARAGGVTLMPAKSATTGPDVVQWSSHFTLSADSSVLLAEQVALQLLAKDTDLRLTVEQWSDLAAVALNTQAIRQAYEASIARATVLERGRYRLEIPAYPEAGDALRTRLYTELREKLGAQTADDVVAQMGSALEGYFAGFGVSVQTLDFTAEVGSAEADYQVTRTVTFWNSVDAKNRLTTRRETHFPGLEDPTGHAWGPYLALLAARVAERAGS